MLVFKRVLLFFVLPLFTLFLFSTATTTNVVRIVGKPAPVEKILADSGIYDTVLTGLLDQSKAVSDSDGSVSLNDPVIKSAAEKTFTPAFIQENTEKVINSVYRWLDGNGTQPDFQIDLSTVKETFADNVASALQTKLAALPVCTVTPSSFDALSATCLPKGLDAATAAAKVRNDLSGGKGFLDHPVINASSIKNSDSGSGKNIFQDKLSKAPDAYKAGKNAPYVLGALAILFAIFIIFLSPTKRKGLRRAGVTLVFVGAVMLGMGFGINWAAAHKTPDIKLSNVVLESKVKDLVVIIGKKIGSNYQQFGAGYIIVGGGLILGTIFINRNKKNKNDDLEGEGRTAEDRIELKEPVKATKFDDEKPAAKAKPAAKPKAIAAKTAPKAVAKPKPKKIIIQ
jgi:hypothetical protein